MLIARISCLCDGTSEFRGTKEGRLVSTGMYLCVESYPLEIIVKFQNTTVSNIFQHKITETERVRIFLSNL